jgi:hypothetical protein
MTSNNPSSKKTAVPGNKLPKGEFPSNIHILKGATGNEAANSRGVSGGHKGSTK